ncbi:MAG: hypothetical protein ACUVQ1_02225 [Candidatus Kapaibacteriales bacterium]
MKLINIFLFSILLILLHACTGEEVEKKAVEKTINQLFVTPGFEWFGYELNLYQPDSLATHQIDSLWRIRQYRFILFAQPSCTCDETQKIFPSIVKSLKVGGVPDSAIKVFLILNLDYSHPFEKKFKVVSLPGCFTEIDSSRSKYYSCLDTFNLYKILDPNQFRIEHIIAMSLK